MSVDTATLEVARDAIAEHRFDALPEIAEQSPALRAALVVDLVHAIKTLGLDADITFHRVENFAEFREQLLAAGAQPAGIYAEVRTHSSKSSEYDAATLRVYEGDRSEITLYSKHRPRTKKPRARRKAASK